MTIITFPKIKKEYNTQAVLQNYYKTLTEQEQDATLENELASIRDLQEQIELHQQKIIALKIAQKAGK